MGKNLVPQLKTNLTANDSALPKKAAVFSAYGVTKVNHMSEVVVQALRGVDLELYEGEFFILLGPSGRGKSTFLTILGGLDVLTGHHVMYRDEDLTAQGAGTKLA